jgi:hypothetical protein
MKTPLRASAVVYVDRMTITPQQIRLEVRLEEIWAEVLGDAVGPGGGAPEERGRST